jgi:hypothetical protein
MMDEKVITVRTGIPGFDRYYPEDLDQESQLHYPDLW